MYPVTIAAAIQSGPLLQEVRSTLEGLPVRSVLEQSDLSDAGAVLHQLERSRAEVVLLDIGGVRDPVEESLGRLRAALPDAMIVALHVSAEAETILSAFRAGVNEFICPPLAANLRRALEWKAGEQRRRESGRHSARTVAFLSAKGGCGATTVACHVAVELG